MVKGRLTKLLEMETINFQKSIDKKRLVYKTNSIVADYIITYIGSLLFITLAGILLATKITLMPFSIVILVFAFIIWMIANLILLNVLVEIKGSGIESNRKEIIKLLNDRFKLNIEDQGQTIIRKC